MRIIQFYFNYNRAEMPIRDPVTGNLIWRACSKSNSQAENSEGICLLRSSGPKGIVTYAKTLPMAIVHSLFIHRYLMNMHSYIDLYELFKVPGTDYDDYTRESVNKAVGHLNRCLGSKYDFFRIEKKYIRSSDSHNVYRLSDRINDPSIVINWDMECSDKTLLERYRINTD